jgi:hypothetical protein
MPEHVQILRVLVVSPGDVKAERALVPRVVDDLNMGIAADRGLRLEAIRWETDSHPGFHPEGPQWLIDTILRIEDSDIVIGIFWKRFGTLTQEGTTGTEHEIRRSCEAWKKGGRPQVMVYFNQKPSTPESPEEADQWGRVLRFRNEISAEGLWWSYKGTREFERFLRVHLTKFIRDKYEIGGLGAGAESIAAAQLAPIFGVSEALLASDAQEAQDAEQSTVEPGLDGQQEHAETLPGAEAFAAKDHVYEASSHALSAELTQPFSFPIKKCAFVRLTGKEEGWLSQQSRNYRLEGAVSFASAYSEVAGSASAQAWNTMASATVEKLNLLDVVTADRVVAKIWIAVPKDRNNSPKINFFGTRFENLRISGTPVDLSLQTGVFAHIRTSQQENEARNRTLVQTLMSSLSCCQNSMALPGLGTLFLCELLLDGDSYQLRMIRLAASSGYSGTITAVTCQASVGL